MKESELLYKLEEEQRLNLQAMKDSLQIIKVLELTNFNLRKENSELETRIKFLEDWIIDL